MLAYKVLLIARMDHLKYLMEKLVQDGKIAKWVLLLSKFDIKYVTQKSMKGRAITDHLAPYRWIKGSSNEKVLPRYGRKKALSDLVFFFFSFSLS